MTSWQEVRAEVRRRILSREWAPGEPIPNEADLARELGCARGTVNRALRSLAEAGLIDRRRKAGTRVALHPVRKATLSIPVVRLEIEERGFIPGYRLISRAREAPPAAVRALMGDGPLLHIVSLHLADGAPFMAEDRWVDERAVPGIGTADLKAVSANEWLVLNVPFSHGEIAFTAAPAGCFEAQTLDCAHGTALFVVERTTSADGRTLTTVRQTFAPGYRIETTL